MRSTSGPWQAPPVVMRSARITVTELVVHVFAAPDMRAIGCRRVATASAASVAPARPVWLRRPVSIAASDTGRRSLAPTKGQDYSGHDRPEIDHSARPLPLPECGSIVTANVTSVPPSAYNGPGCISVSGRAGMTDGRSLRIGR